MSKQAHITETEPIEQHDSGFMEPMQMFKTFPHNDTFVDNRVFTLNANPAETTSDVYTFVHHKQDYSILNLEDATIQATISLKANNGANLGADQIVTINPLPLHTAWKTKEIFFNNQVVNTISTQENELAYIDHLLREVPSGYLPEKEVNLAIHDTPGHFDSIIHFNDATEDTLVNKGANERYQACNQATALKCYDRIDLMCQSKRFIPTSHKIKIILRRADKTKILFGNAGHCGVANVHFDDFKITIPGARPTRVITYMKLQTRYNGAHNLNPNLIAFPDLQFYGLKINEAFVQPLVQNSREAYHNFRTILNRHYDEMPFSHKDYQSSYGIIVTDLSENKDSFNQVLPNSTSGVISLEMRFNQPLAHQYQLINIAEFRNQLSVGYQNQAHTKYDF
ncbi:Hypothetical predicted protein [Paramuricea clavata]|uniref:Uncharacterized protein n=1 Tax=Paramuricea clavata TaxID=317549 RepID=A0A6S7G8H8_PARCT|nr:Hypothetical predicted protein [Paramuricea clavata]